MKREFDCGTFTAEIVEEHYAAGNGLAIQLLAHNPDGFVEPLARLSVNPAKPRELPPRHFFCKDWSENALIIREAAQSGWFAFHPEIQCAICGYELAYVWELLEEKGAGFNYDEAMETAL